MGQYIAKTFTLAIASVQMNTKGKARVSFISGCQQLLMVHSGWRRLIDPIILQSIPNMVLHESMMALY